MASAGHLGQGSAQAQNRLPVRNENCLVLLVIDDANTDWSKYFKSRKINELDLRVEQAEFSELSVVAGADFGCVVSYPTWKDGNKMTRSFQPDFILIRQNLKDAGRDYKNLLLALMYGGVPSVNSLQAVYNFQDKPWVFAHMMNIQRKYGRDTFPLIEQYFYPDFKEMGTMIPRLPAVLKIGHAHGGLGKIRAGNLNDYQDASSVVAVTGTYCTSEPYVEARCDVHIQKIGNQYKAFMKGIVGHWKSSSGSTMLEQVSMNDRYRNWVDSVATLFGGLDICALEIIVGKDGKEYIIEVNDSALTLMGESQEEDRRHIAELVLSRMSLLCKPPQQQSQQYQQQQRYRRQSGSSVSSSSGVIDSSSSAGGGGGGGIGGSTSAGDSAFGSSGTVNEGSAASTTNQVRRDSQSSTGSKTSFFARQNSQQGITGGPAAGGREGGGDDTEDTMKNLRKTFAGIFGDM